MSGAECLLALVAAQRPKMAAINTTRTRTLPIKPTPHNASPHSSWRSLDRPSLSAVFEALMHPNYPKDRKRDWTFGYFRAESPRDEPRRV